MGDCGQDCGGELCSPLGIEGVGWSEESSGVEGGQRGGPVKWGYWVVGPVSVSQVHHYLRERVRWHFFFYGMVDLGRSCRSGVVGLNG